MFGNAPLYSIALFLTACSENIINRKKATRGFAGVGDGHLFDTPSQANMLSPANEIVHRNPILKIGKGRPNSRTALRSKKFADNDGIF